MNGSYAVSSSITLTNGYDVNFMVFSVFVVLYDDLNMKYID